MLSSEADLELIRSEAARALDGLDCAGAMRRLLDEKGSFDRVLWSVIAELGWLGVRVPESLGGLGLGLAAQCVIAEELGRRVGSVPFGVNTCAMSAIALSGSVEQQQLLHEGVRGERIFTVALFEDGETAIPQQPATRFDGSAVFGEKVAVIAGAFAGYALVPCDRDQVVLVDLSQPLVRRTPLDTVDNSRGYSRLTFDGAAGTALPGANALGTLLDDLAVVTAFEQIGGAAACLETTRDYALQRRAFGQLIGVFQAVKHGLADFYVFVQIARGAALSALQASPADFRVAAACARLAAIRAYDHCAQEAIQLHGGIGTTWEAGQHLHLRRSRCLAQEWGSAAFWRDRLLGEAFAVAEAA
jgi:alkylation response protein AidB-like acyl-CoA dehydrogenase